METEVVLWGFELVGKRGIREGEGRKRGESKKLWNFFA